MHVSCERPGRPRKPFFPPFPNRSRGANPVDYPPWYRRNREACEANARDAGRPGVTRQLGRQTTALSGDSCRDTPSVCLSVCLLKSGGDFSTSVSSASDWTAALTGPANFGQTVQHSKQRGRLRTRNRVRLYTKRKLLFSETPSAELAGS